MTDPPTSRRWSWTAARRIVLIGGTAVLALTAVDGCSKSSTATAPKTSMNSMTGMAMPATTATTATSQGMPTLHIENFKFVVPGAVKPGQLIAVMNMDAEAHTVTADDGGFKVQAPAGQTVMLTVPSKPGSYPFHCDYHANMHGVLVVR